MGHLIFIGKDGGTFDIYRKDGGAFDIYRKDGEAFDIYRKDGGSFDSYIEGLGVSSFPPSSYRYCLLQTDKIAIKSNAELARSFSKICVRNHQTCQRFVCGIIKITIF